MKRKTVTLKKQNLVVRWPDLELPIIWEKRRRRSYSLRVLDGPTLQVLSPQAARAEQVLAVVEKKETWLRQAIVQMEEMVQAQPSFENGDYVRFLGELWLLRISPSERVSFDWKDEERECHIQARRPDPDLVRTILEQWYRREAKQQLSRKTIEWNLRAATIIDKKFPQATVSITGARTRWGSCSCKHSHRGSQYRINYSWRLMALPERIVDYVIVHELCHLHEGNHSAAFWALVGTVMPDYKERLQWLHENGKHYVW